MAWKWTAPFRMYLGSRRDLRSIAKSLNRIADHLEGKTPATDLPEAPKDAAAVEVAYTPNSYLNRAWMMEQRLTRTLGRVPTPEEIVRELDEEDAPVPVRMGQNGDPGTDG